MIKLLLIFTVLTHFQVVSAINNPLKALQQSSMSTQWIAYKVSAQNNTRSMCCWNQKELSIKINGDTDLDFKSCDLKRKSHGYGTSSKSPFTDNINIYAKIKNGKVKQLLSVGDACKVKTTAKKVMWIDPVTQSNSIAFLIDIVENAQDLIAEDALYAMSHHKSKKASVKLYEIALKNNRDTSEKAVFWLGEERIDGVTYLNKLYLELPRGDVKQHINFALAQAKNEQAISLLKSIAKNDSDVEQRSDAIFWLSQINVEDIVPFLLNAVESDRSREVQEKAVFSLSQIETEDASNALLTLAETHKQKNIREKALFWLAQSDDPKVFDKLQLLL